MEQGTAHHPNLHLCAFWLTDPPPPPHTPRLCSFLQKREIHQSDKVFSARALVIYSLLTMSSTLFEYLAGRADKKKKKKHVEGLIDTYKPAELFWRL